MTEPRPGACPVCGAETVPGASYCHRCGSRTEDLEGEPAVEQVVESYPAEDQTSAEPVADAAPHPAEGTSDRGPAPASASADEGLARALQGAYEIRIGDWMSRGWDVFTRAGGLFVGISAIVWLLITFASPILIVLGPILMAGLCLGALIVRRGGRLQFSDFWLPFNDFVPLFLAWIVSAGLMVLGILTCGIATIYFWVGYQFVYLLILDRGMDFWDALETSRKAAAKKWLGLFVFACMLLAINLAAYLVTLTLGILVSLPITTCALVEAYADIFGVRGRIPGRAASVSPEAV